jgi:hypothetical protein
MEKLQVLLSLTTEVNDYQQEQARDAEESAQKLGIDLHIIYANNDAIIQSQQLLEAIQNKSRRGGDWLGRAQSRRRLPR